jgi:hypothetical protein
LKVSKVKKAISGIKSIRINASKRKLF